jgi:hypothetical protein
MEAKKPTLSPAAKIALKQLGEAIATPGVIPPAGLRSHPAAHSRRSMSICGVGMRTRPGFHRAKTIVRDERPLPEQSKSSLVRKLSGNGAIGLGFPSFYRDKAGQVPLQDMCPAEVSRCGAYRDIILRRMSRVPPTLSLCRCSQHPPRDENVSVRQSPGGSDRSSRADGEQQTGISHQQVARWRKLLADPERCRERMIKAAYRAAGLVS